MAYRVLASYFPNLMPDDEGERSYRVDRTERSPIVTVRNDVRWLGYGRD